VRLMLSIRFMFLFGCVGGIANGHETIPREICFKKKINFFMLDYK
jgi:hypothetical protein